jgi:hypothetical protein
MAAYRTGQQIRNWFYGQNQGSAVQQQQQAAANNAYPYAANPYYPQYGSTTQYPAGQAPTQQGHANQPASGGAQYAARPQASYGAPRYAAQPQASYRYVEQESDGRSTVTTFDSSRIAGQREAAPTARPATAMPHDPAQLRSMQPNAGPGTGNAYLQFYKDADANESRPQGHNLFTRYRTAHVAAPGGRLHDHASSAPTSRVFGPKWW